jgi:hypothetical protein
MLSTRAQIKLYAPKQVARFGRTVAVGHIYPSVVSYPAGLRIACAASQHSQSPRAFSTTSIAQLKDFFPAKETHFIQKTPAAWAHQGWTEEQMLSVEVGHREPKTVGDWVAWRLIRFARWCMDKATGLSSEQQVDKKNPTTALDAAKPLTEAQWLVRFIFLESIAGGMSPKLYAIVE